MRRPPARIAAALVGVLTACQLLAPEPEPAPVAPVVVDVSGRGVAVADGLLFECDGRGLDAARTSATLERANGDEASGWQPVDGVALAPTGFGSFAAGPLEPGRYRARVEWLDELGRTVGRALVEGEVLPPVEAPKRFLGVSEDLGLGEPLGLRLLWTFRTDVTDPERASFASDARRIAQLVLERAAGPSYSVDAPRLLAVEEARDLLLGASEGERVLPHALGAHALAVVDLCAGPSGTSRAQLGLSLFDLSYRRYQVEQAELRLYNARPLLFEDHVEIELAPGDEARHVDALLAAWRELLGELETDPYVERYVAFLRAEGPGPLVHGAAQRALLNRIGVAFSTDGSQENFELVERHQLFLRAGDEGLLPPGRGADPVVPIDPGPIEASTGRPAADGRRR